MLNPRSSPHGRPVAPFFAAGAALGIAFTAFVRLSQADCSTPGKALEDFEIERLSSTGDEAAQANFWCDGPTVLSNYGPMLVVDCGGGVTISISLEEP